MSLQRRTAAEHSTCGHAIQYMQITSTLIICCCSGPVARIEMKYAGHVSTCRLGNRSHLFLFVIWVAANTVTEHLHCSVYFSSVL